MAERKLRYSLYLGAIQRHQRQIDYGELVRMEREMPKVRPRLRLVDLHRLLTPYVSVRFLEQLWAVVPLALMLVGFQALALRTSLLEVEEISVGILLIVIGLMFFMEGVKNGLMPFAENIGFYMPGRTHPLVLLVFCFLLGSAATLAEPAIGALQTAGASVSVERAPWLRQLLGPYVDWLVLAIAGGVGLAVVFGMLRTMFGWRLKTLVLILVPPALALTVWCATQPALAPMIGLAWDSGGITTGPVTVPLVLAVGVGVAASFSRGDNPLSGFGVVTLASLFPVIGVLVAGIILVEQGVPLPEASAVPVWWQQSPFVEVVSALRAILPLIALLVIAQLWLVRRALRQRNVIVYGICVALVGMVLFNLGLTEGLVALGDQAGSNVPWAFSRHRQTGAPPLYPYVLGIVMTLVFAFSIGYGATIAEPALNAMGITVENLTDGAFRKRLLVHAVAAGVGFGAALGVARILFDLPLWLLLVAGYSAALLLTVRAREEIVNLAWDSAGVTTGPVTVPLLLALGIGLGEAVGAAEGFGILAMCSVGPIISVLATGLWIDAQRAGLRKGKAK